MRNVNSEKEKHISHLVMVRLDVAGNLDIALWFAQNLYFERHARELKAEYRSKGFSSWDQFVAMLFCQLAQARSLREIARGDCLNWRDSTTRR